MRQRSMSSRRACSPRTSASKPRSTSSPACSKRVARKELADVEALIAALRESIVEILAPCAQPLVCRCSAQAVRHPGRRRQRLRQDHDHRQARAPARRIRAQRHACRGRHLPRGGHGAAQRLGRALRRRVRRAAGRRRSGRGRVRRDPGGAGAQHRCAARRHGGPPAQPVAPDGRAEEGQARDPARRSDRAARGAARARCQSGAERAVAGHSVPRGGRRDGPRDHQARRHRQGRHRHRHRAQARHSDPLHRHRRRRRRISASSTRRPSPPRSRSTAQSERK